MIMYVCSEDDISWSQRPSTITILYMIIVSERVWGKRWDPCSNFICLPIKTSAGLRCWELRRSSNFCFLNSSVLSPQQCNLVYCRNCSKNKLKDEMFDITEIAWTNNFWKCQSYSKVLIIKYQMNEYFQAFSVRFALMELLSSEYLHRGKCVENNFEWILFDEKIFVFLWVHLVYILGYKLFDGMERSLALWSTFTSS